MKIWIKKKTKEYIIHLLTIKPELRDNDQRLVSNVISQFLILKKLDANNMTAWKLLMMYADGELPAADYITRVRRKVQEETPELRGKKYQQRHKKAEQVKNNLNNL